MISNLRHIHHLLHRNLPHNLRRDHHLLLLHQWAFLLRGLHQHPEQEAFPYHPSLLFYQAFVGRQAAADSLQTFSSSLLAFA